VNRNSFFRPDGKQGAQAKTSKTKVAFVEEESRGASDEQARLRSRLSRKSLVVQRSGPHLGLDDYRTVEKLEACFPNLSLRFCEKGLSSSLPYCNRSVTDP
jgi:hypothetical protein